MQNVEFNGKKWVIDLDWEILPGDESFKDESKEVAIKTNCNYGISVEYEEQLSIGLAKKNTKLPVAALYLALANQDMRSESSLNTYPDWIVIEEMGDDKYWMSVITGGIPSPKYDKIFDITTVKDEINELLINDTYHLYSPCGEIKSIFDGIKDVENKTLNDLTENITTKIKFIKLRGIPNNIAYAGLAILGLIVIGLVLSSVFDSYSLRQRAEQIQKQQREEEARAEAEYKMKLNAYNDQIEKMKKVERDKVVLGLSGVPSKVLSAWYQVVGSLSPGDNGWKLDSIECKFAPETEEKSTCLINFLRGGLSTNRMLLEDYPDAKLQGDKATVERKILVNQNIFALQNDSILGTLPDAKNWGFDMISQLQLLKIVNINHEIIASKEILITPPKKPLSPKELSQGTQSVTPAPISIGIAQGEVVVKSDNFELLRELADNVDFKAVGVKSVNFKLGSLGSIDWTVKLNYFINTSNGAISQSNSSTLSNDSLGNGNNGNTQEQQGQVAR